MSKPKSLTLDSVIYDTIEHRVKKDYTVADILMGCRKVARRIIDKHWDNQRTEDWVEQIDSLNHIHNRLTDILIAGGYLKEEE